MHCGGKDFKSYSLKNKIEMALASYCSPTVRSGVLISLSISLPSIRGGVNRDSGEEVGLYFLFHYATIRRISPIQHKHC